MRTTKPIDWKTYSLEAAARSELRPIPPRETTSLFMRRLLRLDDKPAAASC